LSDACPILLVFEAPTTGNTFRFRKTYQVVFSFHLPLFVFGFSDIYFSLLKRNDKHTGQYLDLLLNIFYLYFFMIWIISALERACRTPLMVPYSTPKTDDPRINPKNSGRLPTSSRIYNAAANASNVTQLIWFSIIHRIAASINGKARGVILVSRV